ncbi:hypothetical protein BDZ45DRAFT_743638 [Acephala macrosclerotiorum]|nr:hypothetical protein BDZ45DRAFT_743638 [Acephala macrosclerotiorum]
MLLYVTLAALASSNHVERNRYRRHQASGAQNFVPSVNDSADALQSFIHSEDDLAVNPSLKLWNELNSLTQSLSHRHCHWMIILDPHPRAFKTNMDTITIAKHMRSA